MSTSSIILADTLDKARGLTNWYLHQLKGIDVFKRVKYGEHSFNSIYWIVAHLAWTEKNLGLDLLDGPSKDFPFLANYDFGKPEPSLETSSSFPNFKELLAISNEIHSAFIDHIETLSPEYLAEENKAGIQFGDEKSNQMIIQHLIRHEAVHAGHLGWLCKLNQVKTV